MDSKLISQIKLINPWLEDATKSIIDLTEYKERYQTQTLLSPEWDRQWLILTGPRQAGKTTLGKYLCHALKESKRFNDVLYLNCDYYAIRNFLKTAVDFVQLLEFFDLDRPIVFIDEVQRLENPGLLLKAIADLKMPIKMIASGSSQLEIRSKVQEHLTGRQIVTTILPFSINELGKEFVLETGAIYGGYPPVLLSLEKQMQLAQLYDAYVQKDIVEILKVGKPDVLQKLVTLIAHSSGQLVNYNQLGSDCSLTIKTVQHYLSVLEQTFVLRRVTPFVGNKRTEITSNPIYYFIDNGFRNHALGNFQPLASRSDADFLIESLVFQEIYKFLCQKFLSLTVHYWRTKSGAEVDFVLFKNPQALLPIEVKFRTLKKATITRGFRSFLKAYQPKTALFINKNVTEQVEFEGCKVHFIPLEYFGDVFKLIEGFSNS